MKSYKFLLLEQSLKIKCMRKLLLMFVPMVSVTLFAQAGNKESPPLTPEVSKEMNKADFQNVDVVSYEIQKVNLETATAVTVTQTVENSVYAVTVTNRKPDAIVQKNILRKTWRPTIRYLRSNRKA